MLLKNNFFVVLLCYFLLRYRHKISTSIADALPTSVHYSSIQLRHNKTAVLSVALANHRLHFLLPPLKKNHTIIYVLSYRLNF